MDVVKIVDLRIKEWKGQQKSIEMIPQLSFHCVPIELKIVLHTDIALHMTPTHGQQHTIIWQHEKGMFSIRIGHKKECMDTIYN
jgi:hypothetical protein